VTGVKIFWSPQAKADLLALVDYVATDNRDAAQSLRITIFEKIGILAATPNIGRPGRVPGTRELVIESTPYIVPYRCVRERLEILRVYHTSRRWPGRFG